MISFFVGGLKEDIRLNVQMFRPISLSAAIGLARLQEEKLTAKCHQVRIDATQATPFVGTGVGKPSNRPIKKLTPMEMQARGGKGLCYNCDERFSPGHRCKVEKLYLMEGI